MNGPGVRRLRRCQRVRSFLLEPIRWLGASPALVWPLSVVPSSVPAGQHWGNTVHRYEPKLGAGAAAQTRMSTGRPKPAETHAAPRMKGSPVRVRASALSTKPFLGPASCCRGRAASNCGKLTGSRSRAAGFGHRVAGRQSTRSYPRTNHLPREGRCRTGGVDLSSRVAPTAVDMWNDYSVSGPSLMRTVATYRD